MSLRIHISIVSVVVTIIAGCTTFAGETPPSGTIHAISPVKVDPEQMKKSFVEGSESERGAIIDSLISNSDNSATMALGELLLTGEANQSLSSKETIFHELMQRKDLTSAGYLRQAIRARLYYLDSDLIEYFVSLRYEPIIPQLIEYIETGAHAREGMDAIAAIGGNTADAYLLSVSRDPKHIHRDMAIEHLVNVKNSDAVAGLIASLLSDAHTLSDPGVESAFHVAEKLGENGAIQGIMERLISTTENDEIRKKATEILIRSRNMDPLLARRELSLSIIRYQANFALWQEGVYKDQLASLESETGKSNRPERPKSGSATHNTETGGIHNSSQSANVHPASTKKGNGVAYISPPRRTATSPQRAIRRRRYYFRPSRLTPQAYAMRISRAFSDAMGDRQADALYFRLNTALQSYAESNSSYAKFVNRSYRKAFHVDEKKARVYMKAGLKFPGGLSAVIYNIINEYDGRPMQIYALATIFDLPRWQAELIMDLMPEGRL